MKNEAYYRRLGVALRRRRDTIGLTQEVAARRVGVSRPSLANIERGRQVVAAHQLAELVKVLEITDIEQLLLGEASLVNQGHDRVLEIRSSRPNIIDNEMREKLLATIRDIRTSLP